MNLKIEFSTVATSQFTQRLLPKEIEIAPMLHSQKEHSHSGRRSSSSIPPDHSPIPPGGNLHSKSKAQTLGYQYHPELITERSLDETAYRSPSFLGRVGVVFLRRNPLERSQVRLPPPTGSCRSSAARCRSPLLSCLLATTLLRVLEHGAAHQRVIRQEACCHYYLDLNNL